MGTAMFDSYGGDARVQLAATGFFRTSRENGAWQLVTPEGHPFFLVGIAHVDDSALKYPEGLDIYRERYGSRDRWISDCVVSSLRDWGFNALAWTKQWVSPQMRHSPEWTPQEYRDCGLPYIPHIDFLSIERWNAQSVFKNVFGPDFQDWCDYQARYWCAALADDANLIGYAYTARPHWDVSLFRRVTPEVDGLSDDEALRSIVRKYYQVTHDAIRRYDSSHLIFGDLIEGADTLPTGPAEPPPVVFTEMGDYVDVVSVNWYHPFDIMRESLDAWQALCDKPVFLSDSAFVAPNDLLSRADPLFEGGWEKLRVQDEAERGDAYVEMIKKAADSGYVVGWGWCSFMQNRVRKYGLKDRFDEPYECTDIMRSFNARLYENLESGAAARSAGSAS